MRNIVRVFILTLYFLPSISHAQELEETDSIYRLLLIAPGDTNLINSLNSSIDNLSYSHADTALFYATQLDSLSIVAGYPHKIKSTLDVPDAVTVYRKIEGKKKLLTKVTNVASDMTLKVGE